jgi:hypothetical protein
VDDTERARSGSSSLTPAIIIDVHWSTSRPNLLSAAVSGSHDLLFFNARNDSNDVRTPIFSRSLPDTEFIRAFAWQRKSSTGNFCFTLLSRLAIYLKFELIL